MREPETTEEKAKAYDSLKLIEKFNKLYPIGSTVFLRKNTSNECPYESHIVKSAAYMFPGFEAVAFFEGISGCFSIKHDFIKYPD